MKVLAIFIASFTIFSNVLAAPAASKYGLKVQYKKGTGKFNGIFLSFNTYNNNTDIVALADGGTKKATATPYTVSKGSIHVQIPPNMVISSGQYSTNSIFYGSTVIFEKGKGSNDYVTINKTTSRLAFKPEPMSRCTDNCWELCPLERSMALSLGDAKPKGCVDVYILAVSL